MTFDSSTSASTKRAEKMPTRSVAAPRDSKSVYDRLYKAGTISSKARKEVAPVVPKNILMRENEDPAGKPTIRKVASQHLPPKKISGASGKGEVFSRLYQNGTASSVSKRSHNEVTSRVPMKPKNKF